METTVKEDIEKVLVDAIAILKCDGNINSAQMSELSDHTIHNASIFQDEDSISIAILVYSLSKIIQRKKIVLSCEQFIGLFEQALQALQNNNIQRYQDIMKELFFLIDELDAQRKVYIEEVISTAQIKKGSRIYEHGISLARTAAVLGISQWELMGYIGKTNIIDALENEAIDVKERLEYTRSLFK